MAPCQSLCGVRQCGDDGCGASCGECGNGLYCDNTFRCRAGVPPDPGVESDIATSDRGTGDSPSAGDSNAADRSVTDATSCPAGYTQYYGQCIPPKESKSAGGCASYRTPSPATACLLLSLLVVLAIARRRPRVGPR